MPWRATRPMDQRAEFVLKAEQEEVPFRELCEEFGVSPKTGYKWVARFRAGGIAALHDMSTKPRSSPAGLPEVIDNGTGMEAETLERLWEPFFTTKERGRGLGLPSVLGILRAHHAGIALESHPRAGTQFRVYFSEVPASEPQGRSMPG